MSAAGLGRFRDIVLGDVALQAELLAVEQRADFVARVVATARGHGCDVVPEDVEEALDVARRARLERWV